MGSIHLYLVALLTLVGYTNCREHLEFEGKSYYISFPEEEYNWYQAYQYCALLGMHLIDINTDVEHKRVVKLLKYFNGKYNNEDKYYWTSGTDQGREAHYYWMTTGQPIVFDQWGSNMPNNYKYPDTGEFSNCLASQPDGLEWVDLGCSTKRPFICRATLDVTDYQSHAGCTIEMENA